MQAQHRHADHDKNAQEELNHPTLTLAHARARRVLLGEREVHWVVRSCIVHPMGCGCGRGSQGLGTGWAGGHHGFARHGGVPDQEFFGLAVVYQVVGAQVVGQQQELDACGREVAAQTDQQFGLFQLLAVVDVLEPNLLGGRRTNRLKGLIHREGFDQSVEALEQNLAVHVKHGGDFHGMVLAQFSNHALSAGIQQGLVVGHHEHGTTLVRERMKQALQRRQLARLGAHRLAPIGFHQFISCVSNGRRWQKSSKMWTIAKWHQHHIRHFVVSSVCLIQINHKVSSCCERPLRKPSIRTTHSMTLTPHPLIGQSEAMRVTRALIKTLAPSLSSVLIQGESGTGKELIAQALHAQGPRRSGPFVPINCGAIPRELLESELFGHRKGAFTGAVGERMGRFEMANGGTIFLDEIGDLPLDMQVKLLRVLQERQIEPLGANKSVAIDVRVIAATHKDLEKDIAEHKFREDLYYRLNVLPVRTAALRERPEDIAELMSFFLVKFTPPGMKPLVCADNLAEALKRYPWPGNIRELSNIADRFSALYAGQTLDLFAIPEWLLPKGLAAIRAEMPAPPPPNDLPRKSQAAAISGDDAMQALLDPPDAVTLRPAPAPMVHVAANDAIDPALAILGAIGVDEGNPVEDVIRLAMGMDPLLPDGISLRDKLIDIERSYIEQALQRTDWNVSQTARILSLQRTTLIEKINKYGFKRA